MFRLTLLIFTLVSFSSMGWGDCHFPVKSDQSNSKRQPCHSGSKAPNPTNIPSSGINCPLKDAEIVSPQNLDVHSDVTLKERSAPIPLVFEISSLQLQRPLNEKVIHKRLLTHSFLI